MKNIDSFQHLIEMGRFTFFVLNVACIIFVAAVYGFAYKFLNNKFYRVVAIGWLANALYLSLETYSDVLNSDQHNAPAYVTITISLLSTLIFHYAVFKDKKFFSGVKFLERFKPVFGLIPIALCILGIFYASNTAVNSRFFYSLLLIPTVLYSFTILILIAYRFFVLFPNEEFGRNSTLLYGSWGLYGVIQFFYPLAIFSKDLVSIKWLTFFIFVLAFILKIINIIGLLNVLQKEYSNLQDENFRNSVHQEVGEIAAGLHHDIKMPSALIDGELVLIGTGELTEARVKTFIKNVKRANSMISETVRMVDMIQLDPGKITQRFKKTHVESLVSTARGFYNKAFKRHSLKLVKPEQAFPKVYILANSELLTQAFFNIMKNARESLATLLEIRVRKANDNHKHVEFLFLNNGEEITDEEIENCFRAGWSSERKRERRAEEGNVGLGLYMCFRIITLHRGEIEIFNIAEAAKSDRYFRKDLSRYKVGVKITLPIALN